MASPQVLIVEDEILVAIDIQSKLECLGYSIAAVVRSGEDAVAMAWEKHPDMILMDICLEGEMDGVAAAAGIHDRCSIPIVFLTAFGDRDTLQRAKLTEPFGYVVKPFSERDLHAAVEIGLHKHELAMRRDAIQRRHSREAVQERTQELAQRHQELAALNSAFQEHLKVRDSDDRRHQELRSTVHDFLLQIRDLTVQLDRQIQDHLNGDI